MVDWLALFLFLICALEKRKDKMLLLFLLGNWALAIHFWLFGAGLVALFQALLSSGVTLILLFILEGEK